MADADAITAAAPAKLNLRLRVVGRRDDGMHLLDGESVLIDLRDETHFRRRDDGRIVRDWSHPLVADDDDLCIAAARLLRQHSRRTTATATAAAAGATIRVDKRIPIGGGLGGGSSNAATTLLALNRLWECGLNNNELMRLAEKLGADAPFFVFGKAAKIGGIGLPVKEIKTPINTYLLVFPPVVANTAEVYAEYQRLTTAAKIRRIPLALDMSDNDLAPAATRLHPEIAEAAAALRQAAGEARMSGSGATVFAALASAEDARKAQNALPNGLASAVARGINAHPFLNAN